MGSISDHPTYLRSFSATARDEWDSLQAETDVGLRQEGLFALARRQENSGNLEAAGQLYSDLLAQEIAPGLRERVQGSLDAILGRGEVGARAEFLLRRFSQEATDPVMLASMGLAGAAFRATRLAVLSRLSLSSTAGFLTRGLGARALAGLAGFAVEAPVFTLSGRLGAEALGRSQDWSSPALGRDLASSFLVLGGMKLAGWASGTVYRRWGPAPGSVRARIAENLFHQGGTLGGILLGHGLEQWAGLRPVTDRETTLIDSLAMLLQFHVAGRLSQTVFGEGFRAWERGIDRQAEILGRFPRGGWGLGGRAFGPAPALASPALSNMAMMIVGKETTGSAETIPLSPSRAEARLEPSPKLEYPPDIEKIFQRAEARMRAPNYLSSDRARLRELRPDSDDTDHLWFFQLEQILRLAPEIQAEVRDATVLLEPLREAVVETDRLLLERAFRLLRSRGKKGSLARRVVELRIPRSALEGKSELLFWSIKSFSLFSDAQRGLGPRLRLFEEGPEEGEMLLRIPSLSLYEKILQAAFGRRSVQFHPVDGAIPRDDVMELRSNRVAPVAFSRQPLFFGDIGTEVLPFAYTVHDAMAHAVDVAKALEGRPELSGKIYRALQNFSPDGSGVDEMMTYVSDGLLDSPTGFGEANFHHDLVRVFSAELGQLRRLTNSVERLNRLNEMQQVVRMIHPWLREGSEAAEAWQAWERDNRLASEQAESEMKFVQAEVAANYAISYSESPKSPSTLVYSEDLEAVFRDAEARWSSVDYSRMNRVELLASRPSLEALDRLLLFQGSEFASRIPASEYDQVDAEALTRSPAGAALLQRAFSLLGVRGEPGSEARRVLRVSIPVDYLGMVVMGPKETGPWGYLSVIPPVLEMAEVLDKRISFSDWSQGRVRFYYPSFSLSEALFQSAFGKDAGALLPVSGNLTRDQAARVRSLRLTPTGFGRGLLYLGDADFEIHPFAFTGHDQYFHGPRDASQDSRYHELAAGWFYPRVQAYLPDHPRREALLNNLADVELRSRTPWSHRILRNMILSPLQEASVLVEGAGSAPEDDADARAALAEGMRRLVIEEFRHHPLLAGKERFMLADLRALQRRSR